MGTHVPLCKKTQMAILIEVTKFYGVEVNITEGSVIGNFTRT